MARTKKNKTENKKTKKRVKKEQQEVGVAKNLANNQPELLNVKVESEFEQEDDLDFSNKSILNDENIIFSGEIRTNKSHLKNKYFDSVLDEEDLLQAEFDEIKLKSKKSLLTKKKKKEDRTAQAIKESISKRFDGFFDETDQSLITDTIYDGDYKEQEEKDIIEQAKNFSTASDIIEEIIYNSEKRQPINNKEEDVIEGEIKSLDQLPENLADLNIEELTELEELSVNNLAFDNEKEFNELQLNKESVVYDAIPADEVEEKKDVYEPNIHLNIQQPLEINEELVIQSEVIQEVKTITEPNIQNEVISEPVVINQPVVELSSESLINLSDANIHKPNVESILPLIEQKVIEISEYPVLPPEVLEVTNLPEVNVDLINDEVIKIDVVDLSENQTNSQEVYKPSYQSISETIDYSVDLNHTIDIELEGVNIDKEVIHINQTSNKLEEKTHKDNSIIHYQVIEDGVKEKELYVDVNKMNSALNSELKSITKKKKSLDELEVIPAVVVHRTNKKSLDELEVIPAITMNNNFVKQEVINIPENDFRTFDNSVNEEVSKQKSIQELEASLSQIENEIKDSGINIENVEIILDANIVSDIESIKQNKRELLVETDNLVNEIVLDIQEETFKIELDKLNEELTDQTIYPIQKRELNWKFKEDNTQYDMLSFDCESYNNIIKEQNELKMVADWMDYSSSPLIKIKPESVIQQDLETVSVKFKPNYKKLDSELLDDRIYPVNNNDLNWDLKELDVKYNYIDFEFESYNSIIKEQTEFKMFCKKAIDYSKAPIIRVLDESTKLVDDTIELNNSETFASSKTELPKSNLEVIETTEWETVDNNSTIDFHSLINKKFDTPKYYLENKHSSNTEEIELNESNFEGIDENILELIKEQKRIIKDRLISEDNFNSEKFSKALTEKLREETSKIIIKNIAKQYNNINDINSYKKPLVSTEIKTINPFVNKSLKDKLINSQDLRLVNKANKKTPAKSILNDLKDFKFRGPNLIYKENEPKKLTSSK
ncbi:hypothetical protein [Mycoplasma bradburyae]|uniref:hypothetical protein n=1 Tax=Mycoplasma bradburyae TaxID=2963128 RepID=UPI0020CD326A|nr:hypothetical protein [Mycoplasma bradburyae]UTS71127.1 hypothetical protein NMG77_01540 [Mycoplasma bradburyae]